MCTQRLTIRYDPRDLSSVFVRRANGHFVEARYSTLGRPPISLWERNAAVRRLNEKGRREVNEDMIFTSAIEQRAIEDQARRSSAKARRNRERRPVGVQEKQGEVRLRDIDMGAALDRNEDGSIWDEP